MTIGDAMLTGLRRLERDTCHHPARRFRVLPRGRHSAGPLAVATLNPLLIIEVLPSRPAEFGPFQLRIQKDAAHLVGKGRGKLTLHLVISF